MNRNAVPATLRGARTRATGVRQSQSKPTEQHLLMTATRLFSERGFHGTGIRNIADEAGLAVSAMYYYASSKDELLTAIMQHGLDRLIVGSRAGLLPVKGLSERLATLVAFHVSFHAVNPRTARVIDQEFPALHGTARQQVLALRDAYESSWSSVLADGVKAGEFTDRGSAGRLALLQMCTGVAYWYRPDGPLTPSEVAAQFADMSLALVEAQRHGARVRLADLDVADLDVLHASLDDLATLAWEPDKG